MFLKHSTAGRQLSRTEGGDPRTITTTTTAVIVMLARAECLAPVPGTVPLGRGFTSLDSHGDFFFFHFADEEIEGYREVK